MSSPTDRERFCAMLATAPMQRGNAIVVLTGDGTARLGVAMQLLRQDGAPLVVITGGLDAPPYSLPAAQLAGGLMGMGVAPSRIRLDESARNTREQAVNVVKMAADEGWTSLLLVASPEHQFRAFLTFLAAIHEQDATLADRLRLVNVPASNLKWGEVPEGRMAVSRLDLLASEFQKLDTYQDVGHAATYAEGITYLLAWENRS